jgi:hypothetical protein
VVAVSIDRDAEAARRFASTHRLALPVVHDGPDGLARALDLDHVPFTVVLDRDGSVAYTSSESDAAALRRLGDTVRGLLAREPVASRSTEGASR